MNSVKRRISNAVLALAAMVVVVSGVVLATESAAVVVTHGVSMEPLYSEGDLVVVTRAPAYAVGDIVAYRLAEDRSVVLHRIVDESMDTFTMQGDNNATVDPETPDVADIVGRAALHLPQGGVWLERLTSPPVLAAIAFVLLTSGGAVATTRRRRRRRSQSMSQHNARTRSTPVIQDLPAGLKALGASALVLVVGAVALGAYAWGGPLTETTSTSAEDSRMEFGYSAQVEPGPVYDGFEVLAPDAIFLNVVDTVKVEYAYTGEPGTLTLDAELSAEGGWRTSVPLADPARVSGNGASQSVILELRELNERAHAAAEITGVPVASLNIAVVPSVRTAAGGEFHPVLNLTLTPLRLTLAGGPGDLVVTGEAELASATRSRLLGPSDWNISAAMGRTVSAITAAAGLLLLVAVGLLARRQPARSDAEQIRKRYGALLVEVKPLDLSSTQPVVEVRDFGALAKLAEQFSLPVLHWREGDGDAFLVHDDGISYRYRIDIAPTPFTAPFPPARGSVSAVPQP